MTRRDPAPLKTGRCALPGCRKPLPPIAVLHGDSFCSNSCCRAWHDTRLQGASKAST